MLVKRQIKTEVACLKTTYLIISLIYFLKFGAKVQFKLILKSITFIFFEKSGSIFLFYCFLFNILIVTTVSIVKNSANIKKKFDFSGVINSLVSFKIGCNKI